MMHRRMALGALAAVSLLACATTSNMEETGSELRSPIASITLELEPCRPHGAAEALLCSRLEVPEDRSRPDGRKIELGITLVPAHEPDGSAPLYHLVGGPGADTSFWPAIYTGAVPWPIGKVAPQLRHARDVVLVDHRGAGSSNPLHCPDLDAFHRIEPAFPLAAVTACRDRLSVTADLTQYSTIAAVHDLEAVRRALGHGRVTLFGSSYGTSLALAYLRAYPHNVRAAVLAGTLPLDNQIPLEHAAHAQRVFERIFDDCAADTACAEAFPDLHRRWRELLVRLEEDPPRIEISDTGGRPRTIEIRRGPFVESLRSRLGMYVDQREIPLLVDQAVRGHFEPLLERVIGGDGAFFSMGLYLSAQCPTTLRARSGLETATAGTALGDYRVRSQLAACEVWPKVETPAGWYEPVRVDVPVLLLTGDLDHETPAHWGDAVARELPRASHVVVPNMGHAWFDADQKCFLGVVEAFLREPAPDELDASCLAENAPLPFVLGEERPSSG